MRPMILIALISMSTVIASFTVFSRIPQRIVLGWLGVGFSQSAFLLIVGFEFLALLNLLFVIACATVLQIYSALFGTAAIRAVENGRDRKDWIYGLGTGATIAAILVFAWVGTFPSAPLSSELTTTVFSLELLKIFPELSWIMGVTLFLGIIVWAVVGRPGWKRTEGSKS